MRRRLDPAEMHPKGLGGDPGLSAEIAKHRGCETIVQAEMTGQRHKLVSAHEFSED